MASEIGHAYLLPASSCRELDRKANETSTNMKIVNDAKVNTTRAAQNTNNIQALLHHTSYLVILFDTFGAATSKSRASSGRHISRDYNMNRFLQYRKDSSADESPQEMERSLPLFAVFWMACVCFIFSVMRCFGGYCKSRRRQEDQSEDYGDTRPSLVQTSGSSIKEVERRKTLMHSFQRNQVTMVRICARHFRFVISTEMIYFNELLFPRPP